MAERRMFAKSIVLSDAFLDMPMSARCLYFTLGMLADDEGFIGAPKSIMRQCGASQDDMNILIAKRYVLAFDSGVIVIKHWRLNNYLQKDRCNPTTYVEEKSTLMFDEKKSYTEIKGNSPMYTDCIHSIDKYSIVESSLEEKGSSIDTSKHNNKSSTPKETITTCTEQLKNSSVLALPLNDGTEYEVQKSMVEEFEGLYPAVDVMQELRNMRGWLLNNPRKRKTKRGINAFINAWLAREQDKGKGGNGRSGESGSNHRNVYEHAGIEI